jgi:hypothetical protein
MIWIIDFAIFFYSLINLLMFRDWLIVFNFILLLSFMNRNLYITINIGRSSWKTSRNILILFGFKFVWKIGKIFRRRVIHALHLLCCHWLNNFRLILLIFRLCLLFLLILYNFTAFNAYSGFKNFTWLLHKIAIYLISLLLYSLLLNFKLRLGLRQILIFNNCLFFYLRCFLTWVFPIS